MTENLRFYQREAVENCIKLHKERKNSQLLILPTGTGKTRTFCAIIKRLNYKALIISHTSQLRNQIEKECKIHCPGQFVFSKTVQSLINIDNLNEMKKINFDMLIVDEAHHATSASYENILRNFCKKLVIGCTATPFRLDQQSIYQIFKYIICQKTILEMVEHKFLCDIKGYRVKTNLKLDSVRIVKGDFSIGQLASIINSKNRNQIILSSYKKIINNKKTVIFCVDINHCEEVSKIFLINGIRCAAIHGKLKKEEQFLILDKFRKNEISVLTTCQLLTEGFDEPSIEALMICRPTKSAGLYIQMVGRGLRTFPSKKYCEIVELTDNSHDICSFESIITEKTIRNPYEKSEKVLSIKSIKDEVEISEEDIIVEEKTFITKYEKGNMSDFQREYLVRNNVKFIEPISYFCADLLIQKFQSGIHYGIN